MEGSKPARKPTSADVRAALVLRYPADSHALMFEVAPRTGGGTRYADAVAVGLWASHGHKIEGFEIKVARSDWLNELKQPEKSEPVMRFCNYWWLACPKGVASVDELPPNWGMLELQDSGTLKIKVQASKLEPAPVSLSFFASLVRRGTAPDNAALESLLQREAAKQRENIKQELQRASGRELSHKLEQATLAAARLDALKEKTGIDFAEYRYGDDWFAAVELLHSLGAKWGKGSLSCLRTSLLGVIDVIDRSQLLVADEGAANG